MELHRSRVAAGDGETIDSLSNAINIHDADVHRVPINHLFYQERLIYTLTADITSQDRSFTVTDATGLAVGDKLHLTDTSNNNHEAVPLIITTIVTNTITINRPIDYDYLAASTEVVEITTSMNVDGSVTPQSFIVLPSPGMVWHITSMDFSITDQTAMDDAKFGGITALTNGVMIRGVDSVSSNYLTFSVWQKNSDFNLDAFTTNYAAKAPSGFYGYSGTMNIHDKYTSIVRLANTATETIYMEVLVQDDLSTLDTFEIKVHGHIEG